MSTYFWTSLIWRLSCSWTDLRGTKSTFWFVHHATTRSFTCNGLMCLPYRKIGRVMQLRKWPRNSRAELAYFKVLVRLRRFPPHPRYQSDAPMTAPGRDDYHTTYLVLLPLIHGRPP